MAFGIGFRDRTLSDDERGDVMARAVASMRPDGKRVLVIIPDGTRSVPMPLIFRELTALLRPQAAQLDYLIALGTHLAMSEQAINAHLGLTPEERSGRYGDVGVFNHDWRSGLTQVGEIASETVEELSAGLMQEAIPVTVNARLLDYDQILIVGPVFPHAVVGFSGGTKYLFPGVSGPGMINVTHWLAGLVGNIHIIGRTGTPIRRMLDLAAECVPVEMHCLSMVIHGEDELMGLYFGGPKDSQVAAAELSAQVNVVYTGRQYKTVLAIVPDIYDDFWTGCKGMLKCEPVVADGGTLIIYAPHIDEISYTHGHILDRLGYHVRDYYLAHWDQVGDADIVALGHAALVRGVGGYVDGVETLRINLDLATSIPQARCRHLNLGYRDPAKIDPSEWQGRKDEGILVVPRAGELLYRVAPDR